MPLNTCYNTETLSKVKMDLAKEIHKVNWNDDNAVIKFYESHRLYFQNHHLIDDQDSLVKILYIKLKYGNVLFLRSYYDKVYPILDQAKMLLSKIDKGRNEYDDLYVKTRFLEGRTLNNHKKFKESDQIFKELVQKDPDNYTFREWYYNNKVRKFDIYHYVAAGIGVSLVGIDIIFRFINPINAELSTIGIGVLVATYFTHHLLVSNAKSKINSKA